MHCRQIGVCVQQAVVHTPRKTEGEEATAARFRDRNFFSVEQARPPQSILPLDGDQGDGHFAKELHITRTVRVILRHVFEDQRQTGEDPAVAPRPEDLLTVGGPRPRAIFLDHITAVAIPEVFLAIVEIVVSLPPHGVHEIEVT